MATIEKRERKSGTVYLVDIRIAGFPRQKKTFQRLTDAKIWAAKTETAIRNGEIKNIVRTAKRKTLSDVIHRYEEEVLPNLAKTTQRAAQTYLGYWQRELGAHALSFVTPELISDQINKLADAPDGRSNPKSMKSANEQVSVKPKSRKTLKHYRDTLAVLFKYAQQWGWIGSNPLDGVNKITGIRDQRDRYLEDSERKVLLEACRNSPNQQLYPIVIFALSTGARRSEILGLSLRDIDMARGLAILRDTKNGETRSVPIVGHLHELLTEQIQWVNESYNQFAPNADNRWLFPRRDLRAAIDIRTAWENALVTSGVRDFRFHDLRHSTASYLAMQGAGLLEIADMLGHKTLQMVKRYAHLSGDHKRGLAEKLNDKMF